MSEKAGAASELFMGGRNCAQSVFCAFCEDYGIKTETAARLAGGFGGGVRSAEICGAITGAVMVIGLKHGESKEICGAKTVEFIEKFRDQKEAVVCRELLGCDITTPEGKEKAAKGLFKPTCRDLVVSAVNILEELGY